MGPRKRHYLNLTCERAIYICVRPGYKDRSSSTEHKYQCEHRHGSECPHKLRSATSLEAPVARTIFARTEINKTSPTVSCSLIRKHYETSKMPSFSATLKQPRYAIPKRTAFRQVVVSSSQVPTWACRPLCRSL